MLCILRLRLFRLGSEANYKLPSLIRVPLPAMLDQPQLGVHPLGVLPLRVDVLVGAVGQEDARLLIIAQMRLDDVVEQRGARP